jgi:hypothetical protein
LQRVAFAIDHEAVISALQVGVSLANSHLKAGSALCRPVLTLIWI